MNLLNITRKFGFTVLGLLLTGLVCAQVPQIRAVDRISGPMADTLVIQGSNFGNNATRLVVSFGAVRNLALSVRDGQLIKVLIPHGATYDNLSVARTDLATIGYSPTINFLLSYGGAHPFNVSNLSELSRLDNTNNLGDDLGDVFDHCLCDVDRNGNIDIITTDQTQAAPLSMARTILNASTATPDLISTGSFGEPGPTLHVQCADLNGDGIKDLIYSEYQTGDDGNLIVYQNASAPGTVTLSSTFKLPLPGVVVNRIRIADIDLDGKPDILVSDRKTATDAYVHIYKNTTPNVANANITFASIPIRLTVPGGINSDVIEVADLNGDRYPEIIFPRYQSSSNLYVVTNASSPGNIGFGTISEIPVGTLIKGLKAGDLDGDGKIDIAITRPSNSTISIFRNTTTGSAITFSAISPILVVDRPWSLDFGDMDGDGKVDIVVGSRTQAQLTILNNTGSPGTISFTPLSFTTAHISNNVTVGDMDSDGKPDIVVSTSDLQTPAPGSAIVIYHNSSCVVPVISPAETPLEICSTRLPYTLRAQATGDPTASYQWTVDGSPTGTNSRMNNVILPGGMYRVRLVGENGACNIESAPVTVTVTNASIPAFNVDEPDPVCPGSTLNLSVTATPPTPGLSYEWSGPAGYTASGATVSRTNFELGHVGEYKVDVYAGTCLAKTVKTSVAAFNIPQFQVSPSGTAVTCSASKVLTLSPFQSTFTYDWYRGTTLVQSGPSPSYTAMQSGEYSVRPINASCTVPPVPPVNLYFESSPVASFSAPTSACAGQVVNFTNLSNLNESANFSYQWDFGNGQQSSEKSPSYTYPSAGTFTVTLTASYPGSDCPSDVHTEEITITPAPVLAITSSTGTFSLCEGATLTLTASDGFGSYSWSGGQTSQSIDVSTAGTYSVNATGGGCPLTSSREVTAFPAPTVLASAAPPLIEEGLTSQLSATGLLNYQWTPGESLSDPLSPNPVATPSATTVFTVSGTDANGCTGSATVEIVVKGEPIVRKLGPKNFFSPNEDASNPVWEVENILTYPQCGVVIYDDKGIKVFEGKPYENTWDGTFNGRKLNDGVYYYIIRCDGQEDTPRSGSITLLR